MSLTNEIELANTRAKLAELEQRYEELRHDTVEDAHVREVTMKSLKRYINQFKEEIARYEAGQGGRNGSNLQCEQELKNTRRKLRELEMLYEANKKQTGGDEELRRAESISLKRLINQLKEEIARYEAHQPARG